MHVGLALVVALLATRYLSWGAAPFWLIAAFVVQFFRDPHRVARQVPDGVLAAADGRVVVVGRAHDPWLDRDALKISVFMNVFNVHSNRSPVSGEVRQVWYHPGSFLNAAIDKASLENERNAIWLRTGAVTTSPVCRSRASLLAAYCVMPARVSNSLQVNAMDSSASARASTSTCTRMHVRVWLSVTS